MPQTYLWKNPRPSAHLPACTDPSQIERESSSTQNQIVVGARARGPGAFLCAVGRRQAEGTKLGHDRLELPARQWSGFVAAHESANGNRLFSLTENHLWLDHEEGRRVLFGKVGRRLLSGSLGTGDAGRGGWVMGPLLGEIAAD